VPNLSLEILPCSWYCYCCCLLLLLLLSQVSPDLGFSSICKVSTCNELLLTWLSEQGTKPVVNEKNFISSLIVVIVVACCCCHCRIESSIHSNVSLSDPDLTPSPLFARRWHPFDRPSYQPSNRASTHTLLSPSTFEQIPAVNIISLQLAMGRVAIPDKRVYCYPVIDTVDFPRYFKTQQYFQTVVRLHHHHFSSSSSSSSLVLSWVNNWVESLSLTELASKAAVLRIINDFSSSSSILHFLPLLQSVDHQQYISLILLSWSWLSSSKSLSVHEISIGVVFMLES